MTNHCLCQAKCSNGNSSCHSPTACEQGHTVDDLVDFDETTLKLVADNMKNPGGQIPNPDPNASPRTMIPHPPFTFGAK